MAAAGSSTQSSTRIREPCGWVAATRSSRARAAGLREALTSTSAPPSSTAAQAAARSPNAIDPPETYASGRARAGRGGGGTNPLVTGSAVTRAAAPGAARSSSAAPSAVVTRCRSRAASAHSGCGAGSATSATAGTGSRPWRRSHPSPVMPSGNVATTRSGRCAATCRASPRPLHAPITARVPARNGRTRHSSRKYSS
ncbi:hypothetical protein BJF78_10550 [Pseudonocardia sp. CNS-139]|nr:hypothetical protein BJF78_10550 [Pseudonocardia sp. CNS-139]